MIVLLLNSQENDLPQVVAVSHHPLQLSLELADASTPLPPPKVTIATQFKELADVTAQHYSAAREAPPSPLSKIKQVSSDRTDALFKELDYMLSPFYPDPLELYAGPKVQLFKKEDAIAALDNAQLCDPESCARISKIIKALISHGDSRKLAQLETDFLYSLRCLLDKYQQFQEVVEYVVSAAALAQYRGDRVLRMSPILLVGEAGVGKTEFVEKLSALLKVGFKKIDLAAAQSNHELAGSSSFWSNSAPSKIFLMASQGALGESFANPVFLLDELDKPAHSAGFTNADPLGVLHTLLEPHSARSFTDLAIDIPIDVSNYIFFATCNDAELIPKTIRSRFREFTITITKDQMEDIAHSIAHELIDELPESNIVFDSATIEDLSNLDSPRSIRKHAKEAMGRALAGGRSTVHPVDLKIRVSKKIKMGFL